MFPSNIVLSGPDKSIADYGIDWDELKHKDVLIIFPISMLIGSIAVKTFGAPWEIVDSAECKDGEDVDVSGGKEEVAEDRRDHFDVFP